MEGMEGGNGSRLLTELGGNVVHAADLRADGGRLERYRVMQKDSRERCDVRSSIVVSGSEAVPLAPCASSHAVILLFGYRLLSTRPLSRGFP